MNKTHELDILSKYFSEIVDGTKTFILIKNDKWFKVGDTLILREINIEDYYSLYTGEQVSKKVTYILDEESGLDRDYVILAIK